MNDPAIVRGFDRLRDLPGDGQRLVDRDRAARMPLRALRVKGLAASRVAGSGFVDPASRDRGEVAKEGAGAGDAADPWSAHHRAKALLLHSVVFAQ
jgi:hypothetical protein